MVRPGATERAAELVAVAVEAYGNGDYNKTIESMEQVKNVTTRSGRVRELLGLAYYHSGRWQEAARELLAYRRMTRSLEQNHVIADCYRALGRPERALEVCDEVAKRDVEPEIWAEVSVVAASALADQRKFDSAIARLARADMEPKSVEPYHLRLWYVRADILEKLGKDAAAHEQWERILDEDPDFFDVADRIKR